MSEWLWFMLGGLTAFLPCLLVMVILVARSIEGDRRKDNSHE